MDDITMPSLVGEANEKIRYERQRVQRIYWAWNKEKENEQSERGR